MTLSSNRETDKVFVVLGIYHWALSWLGICSF